MNETEIGIGFIVSAFIVVAFFGCLAQYYSPCWLIAAVLGLPLGTLGLWRIFSESDA